MRERFGQLNTRQISAKLGFAVLCFIMAASLSLLYGRGLDGMMRSGYFSLGMDVAGVAICLVLYYSCMTEWRNTEQSASMFTGLIFVQGCILFFSECTWLVMDIPSLRMWNVLANVLFFMGGGALHALFWRYIYTSLHLQHNALMRILDKVLLVLLAVEMCLALANLFFPVIFSVDEAGHYARAAWYPYCLIYALLCLGVTILGLILASAPLRQKLVILSFAAIPFFSMYLTRNRFGISTQYASTLVSIVLIYGAVYAERGRQIAVGDTELELSAKIQHAVLSRDFPRSDRYSLWASMEPAKEVGGDFYDFFPVGGGRVALVMADVSGKGVPAALFMMNAKALIRNAAQKGMDPAQALREVNAQLCENNSGGMFVTVWLGILDPADGSVVYADAGHEKTLLRRDGVWSFVPKKSGVALAMWQPEDFAYLDERFHFHNETLHLGAGDMLMQYTDGITEAENDRDEMFGDERLLAAANAASTADPKELLEHIRAAVNGFAHGAAQFDDITMLAVSLLGG